MMDPSKTAKLGNVYAVMAAAAVATMEGPYDALGLVIDEAGTLEAFGTQHPRYADLVTSPGFVGFLGTDADRLAQRIAAAHAKVVAS